MRAYPDHMMGLEWDLGEELKRWWQILLSRRWVLVTTFVLTVVTAAIYGRYQVQVYRAAATLIIESDIPQLSELDQGLRSKESGKFYQSQYEMMRSFAVAERAFGMLELVDQPPYKDLKDPVAQFQRLFTVEPVKGTQLVRISSTGKDPKRVARRVNTMARAYVHHNLEDRHKSSSDAFVWLSEQLRILETQVASSEKELLAFQAQEEILSLDRRRPLLEERLSEWTERHTEATMARMELETLLSELERIRDQPEMLEGLPQALHNTTIQQLKTDYARLTAELAQLTRKLKPKHPKRVDLEAQLTSLRASLLAELETVAQSVGVEYRIRKINEAGIAASLEDLKRQSARLAQQGIEYAILEREAASNRQMYDVLLQRLKETDIGGHITVNNVRIVDLARAPTAPVGPGRVRLLYYGAVWGLILGLAFCYIADLLDNGLHHEEDVRLHLGLPIIGSVPKEKSGELGSARFLHAYRDIKTQLGFYAQEHRLKCLLITSSVPAEGKTTTLVQLGQAFAQAGSRVLLVDADLYRPRLRKLFGLETELGLTDVILGDKAPEEVIVEADAPNLSVLPAGLLPPEPSELLGSEKMGGLLTALRQDFDLVLIESAPLSAGLETASLGRMADGIALVVRANSTPRVAARKGIRRLRDLKGNVLGVVLTAVVPAAEELGHYYKAYARPLASHGNVES